MRKLKVEKLKWGYHEMDVTRYISNVITGELNSVKDLVYYYTDKAKCNYVISHNEFWAFENLFLVQDQAVILRCGKDVYVNRKYEELEVVQSIIAKLEKFSNINIISDADFYEDVIMTDKLDFLIGHVNLIMAMFD